jgi:alpha-tubulin suppressor-like RCC1 family protein
MEVENLDPFEGLSAETILNIALFEPIQSISSLCQTSQRFNEIICDSEYFWKNKFIHDFGIPTITVKNWKMLYENYGTVIGFGYNESGDLGTNNRLNYYEPVLAFGGIKAKSISCGILHTMFIDLHNNLWATGSNNFGQLGLFAVEYTIKPIKLGWNNKAKAVSCGASHTIIIDMDNNVWGFGFNNYGQLGLGDRRNRRFPTLLTHMGQNMKARSVHCGVDHTLLIDMEYNVWVFGSNFHGGLGLGINRLSVTTPHRLIYMGQNIKAKSASCGENSNLLIDLDDNVWAFGSNEFGELGLGDNEDKHTPFLIQTQKAKHVSCGRNYGMIIDMNDNVWGFGSNEFGELGLGDNNNRNIPEQLFWNLESKAKSISCGQVHTVMIDINNYVWTFGAGNDGQLGLGNNIDNNFPQMLTRLHINIKAQSVCCGSDFTLIILDPSLRFEPKIISYNEAVSGLKDGRFIDFNIFPEFQEIRLNPQNVIASFYDDNDNMYLAEIYFDSITDQLYEPF